MNVEYKEIRIEIFADNVSCCDSNCLYIKKDIYKTIINTIGKISPETGGILGGNDNIVLSFCFDYNADVTGSSYSPCLDEINNQITKWAGDNIDFLGFIHSHEKLAGLSFEDIEYAKRIILKTNGLSKMYMLILTFDESNFFILKAYCFQMA